MAESRQYPIIYFRYKDHYKKCNQQLNSMTGNQTHCSRSMRLGKESDGGIHCHATKNHQPDDGNQQYLVAALVRCIQLILGCAKNGSDFAIWCGVVQVLFLCVVS